MRIDSEDTEDRRVDVVDADASNIDEAEHVVLVRDV